MPALVIVESPAKAKTISNFLGKNYRVEASYGHVRDLPANRKELPEEFRSEKWADFAVDIDHGYKPIYVIPDEKRKVIARLKEALRDADELLLATDEDREGESISWHLLEILDPKRKLSVRRIVFHEITREAIRKAIENPRALDLDLVHAQEGRRIVDRLFGYKLSPILWRKVQPGLSAGRVQSAAVRLLVEREEERRAFVASEYWDLEADIAAGSTRFKATLVSVGGQRVATGKDFDPATGKLAANSKAVLIDAKRSRQLAEALRDGLPWTVDKIEEKPGQQNPYPPFTTSTLQQEANRKLNYGAKKTMKVAQTLYEGVDIGEGERVGLITYMRTDSFTLSEKALNDAQDVIRRMYGPDYARGKRHYKTKTRNAQEAHEAIRPTEMSRRPQDVAKYLDRDELALYDLIWKRTMASQMPNAEVLRTTVEIGAKAGVERATFTASGKRILFPGFLRAYVEGTDDPGAELGDQETVLPPMKPGQPIYDPTDVAKPGERPEDRLVLAKLDDKQHVTQPPARYTEASLVKKLEEEGIGRPSTYASIISTIQERGYVFTSKQKMLIPTFVAMSVTALLREHFGAYVDLKFTARMEEELDEIAGGSVRWEEKVDDFYRGAGGKGGGGLEALVDAKQASVGFANLPLGRDPETDREVQIRIGKYGPYLMRGENGSSEIVNIPREMAPADLTLEAALKLFKTRADGPRCLGDDPATGQSIYVMSGRFGDYVQLGETPEDKEAPKPRRASLEKGQTPDTIDIEQALALLAFPRELGRHPETDEPVLANKGKYGPYVQHGKEFRSLQGADDPATVTLERALELLAAPKAPRAGRGSAGASRAALRELGPTPAGKTLKVMDGRYGAYVTDGETNATIPKNTTPESLTMEQAIELLEARAAAGPSKKKGAKKAAAPKKEAAPKKAPAKAKVEKATAKAAAKPKAPAKAKKKTA